MKQCRIRPWFAALIGASLIAAASIAHADSHSKDAAPAKPEDQAKLPGSGAKTDAAHDAAMADAMKLAMPNAKHAWLGQAEGTWKAKVKTWFAPGEPTVTDGASVNRMIMGGRYLEQKFTGSMFGTPFEGYGLSGYDNATGKYQSFWVDNTSTSMMLMTGTTDESGKLLTMTGSMTGPDGKPAPVRSTSRVVDARTQTFSMYSTTGGKEQLWMEITYTK